MPFVEGMENLFKCPKCGKILNLIKDEEFKETLKWKIKQIEEELEKRTH
jgi:transcription initiation factor IIE alpha subunit